MKSRFLPIVLLAIAVVTVLAMITVVRNRTTQHVTAGKSVDSQALMVMLDQLKVEPESAKPYSSNFGGSSWQQRHGCSTRALVLKAESRVRVTLETGSRCKPESGDWQSPYDNKLQTLASALDIDHMVPKKEAWQSGAWRWSEVRRKAYKNDIGYGPSLIAVTKSENEGGKFAKGDKEPGHGAGYYLPPSTAYQCTYVGEWIAVKWRWSLSVDPGEKNRLSTLVQECAGKVHLILPARI